MTFVMAVTALAGLLKTLASAFINRLVRKDIADANAQKAKGRAYDQLAKASLARSRLAAGGSLPEQSATDQYRRD